MLGRTGTLFTLDARRLSEFPPSRKLARRTKFRRFHESSLAAVGDAGFGRRSLRRARPLPAASLRRRACGGPKGMRFDQAIPEERLEAHPFRTAACTAPERGRRKRPRTGQGASAESSVTDRGKTRFMEPSKLRAPCEFPAWRELAQAPCIEREKGARPAEHIGSREAGRAPFSGLATSRPGTPKRRRTVIPHRNRPDSDLCWPGDQ
jgi:hypothetical protein